MMNMQKMINLRGYLRSQNIITQNMSNLRAWYTDNSESKAVHVNKSW